MIRKLKASLEAKDAADRKPYAYRVVQPSRFRTTGGTSWGEKAAGLAPPADSRFLHMNTDLFTQHLHIPED